MVYNLIIGLLDLFCSFCRFLLFFTLNIYFVINEWYSLSSLPLLLRFEIKIAIPTVNTANSSTIDPTINAVSPRRIGSLVDGTVFIKSPKSYFNNWYILFLFNINSQNKQKQYKACILTKPETKTKYQIIHANKYLHVLLLA